MYYTSRLPLYIHCCTTILQRGPCAINRKKIHSRTPTPTHTHTNTCAHACMCTRTHTLTKMCTLILFLKNLKYRNQHYISYHNTFTYLCLNKPHRKQTFHLHLTKIVREIKNGIIAASRQMYHFVYSNIKKAQQQSKLQCKRRCRRD